MSRLTKQTNVKLDKLQGYDETMITKIKGGWIKLRPVENQEHFRNLFCRGMKVVFKRKPDR